MHKLDNGIGLASEWSGKLIGWAVVVMAVSITYDVMMRYIFNAPTNWSYILSYMLGGTLYVVCLAYGHYRNIHVRIDVVYTRFSSKPQLIINILFDLILLPVFFLLTMVFAQDVWHAYLVGERAMESLWYPIVWPWKAIITFGFGLMFLQGLVIFIKNVMALVKGVKGHG